jgi:hypothetical protein
VRLRDGEGVVAEHLVPGGRDLPELVRLRTDRPVGRVEVCAGPDGALVSDLVLTARPRTDGPETAAAIPAQRHAPAT